VKITIESTEELAELDGKPVRLWVGTTEGGAHVVALVALVGVQGETAALEREIDGLLEREVVLRPTPATS